KVVVATADGSVGTCGFVTTVLAEQKITYDYLYACGPLPMLRALCEQTTVPGQLSMEERMGCGFGGCMGCTCQTTRGAKRICKEGPVLMKEEIIW
ncbi:MAG: dihydroorotate dehydrogenase electron transfer subunit, partial [Alistipes sp.]